MGVVMPVRDRLQWSVNLNPVRLSPVPDVRALESAAPLALDALGNLGVQYVRVDIHWSWWMPGKDRLDEAIADWYVDFVRALESREIRVYGILYNPPSWATDLAHEDLDAFLEAWRTFVRDVHAKLGDRVGLWQVWNEPNNWMSHIKDDLNLFLLRPFNLGGWQVDLPVGVHWKALVGLYRVAREELPPEALVVYNCIPSVSDVVPGGLPRWLDWLAFTDELMQRAGTWIDAIALDHYPDTWVPGVGPHDWHPLEAIHARVHDPRSTWYGKTVLIGEFGYSSLPNVEVLKQPFRVRMFPEDHSHEGQATWYREVMPTLRTVLAPRRWPHNRLHLANAYELFDGSPLVGLNASAPDMVHLEYHFGLCRADGSPKPAFEAVRDGIREASERGNVPRPRGTGPLGLLRTGYALTRRWHTQAAPLLYQAGRLIQPRVRRHDRWIVPAGAALLLLRWWMGRENRLR
ncbi:MAG: hypothetical protein VKP72_02870 [bacterium]|nr:hypothetical protein [bacterium]